MNPRVNYAYRQVAEISAEIAAFVEPTVNKLRAEDDKFRDKLLKKSVMLRVLQ